MDALATIGLTGNVLQFIQFVSALVSTGSEVYHSASGASKKAIELEKIYQRLSIFTSSLQRSPKTNHAGRTLGIRGFPAFPQTVDNTAHLGALNDLAKDCSDLCEQLLEMVEKLRVKGGQWRRFRSFKAALKTAWDSKTIEDLESRLERFQRVIYLHFFPILSDQQSSLMGMVTLLRQESHHLNLDQSSKLDTISTTLQELKSTTERLNKELSTHQSGIMGPSRAELSSARSQGIFRHNQSSLITSNSVDTLSKEISRLTLTDREVENISREQEVLRSLEFPSRPVRHDNIPIAHEKTFQWMIKPPDGRQGETGNQFPDWLRDGDGIFWVSGKPGSGKSTLMKFLANHQSTRFILEEWANDSKLVVATHYFWSAGTAMQKSHKGLFQTLLYEIFRTCPTLISEVCPVQWAQTSPVRMDKNTDWTISELSGAFQALSSCSDLPVRFCFFIDGIDEFDGDHFRLCEILKELSKSPNIKLCLASRPWNVFTDNFGNNPRQKICIEDLTRDDILQYTESRLKEHQRWNVCHFRAEDKQCIIDDITGKAQGVFLWVFLVTKSLRDGLTNGDTMFDLRIRLQSLPTDLERFFKHMLEVVDPIYHEKMTNFLSLAVNAKQPLHFLIYSMHEYGYQDEDYALKMPSSPLSEGEMEILRDECRRRVSARCGGLLDMKGPAVEFLHRTVRDFLFTREMSDFLSSRMKPKFSVHLTTLRAYVATLKRMPQQGLSIYQDPVRQMILKELLEFAIEALEDLEEPATELLNNIEDLCQPPLASEEMLLGLQLMSKSSDEYVGEDQNFCNSFPEILFREELLSVGVDKYVLGKLQDSPHYFDNINVPPLIYLTRQDKLKAGHLRIISSLLHLGQDPNATQNQSQSSSPWAWFIINCCDCEENFQIAIDAGTFSQFLHCGARRDVAINELRGANIPTINSEDVWKDFRVTPCGRFIKALFSHPSNNPVKSLQVLDDFFDLSLGTQLHPAVLDSLQEEIHKINPRATKPERLRLFAKIAEKVLSTGAALNWEMSFLVHDIVTTFPSNSRSTMLSLIRQNIETEDREIASRKRRPDINSLDQITKRAKNNQKRNN